MPLTLYPTKIMGSNINDTLLMILLAGDHGKESSCLNEYIVKEFDIEDLGYLKYILGVEVSRSESGIVITLQKNIVDWLETET